MFSLEMRSLIVFLKYPKMHGRGLSQSGALNSMSVSHEETFHLDIRKMFLIVRTVQQWNQAPSKEVVSTSLMVLSQKFDRNFLRAILETIFLLQAGWWCRWP